jgi:glycosyltransferase involved in cell wall biosynthesis
MSKILRKTNIIAIGSGAKYLKSLDQKLSIREVFPGNSIPSNTIKKIEKKTKKKIYDAVYVGTLTEQKGVIDAIYVWSLVVKKYAPLKLFLIGRTKNPIELNEIKHLINRLKLKNNVFLCDDPIYGASSQSVLNNIERSRIMLAPSVLEAWSLSIGEALSMGIPVVAYDILAYKKSYKNCKALIKVPVGNRLLMSKEIIKLFEKPKTLLALSREAKRYMKNYYTWNDVISSEKKIYKQIMRRI